MSRRSITSLVAAAALALVLLGCSSDDEAGAGSTTTTEATTTTASTTTTTTTTTAPAATAPSQPTGFATTNRDASNVLKDAWENGDAALARTIAPGDAVDALFFVPSDGWETYGCDSGEFEYSVCNYRNRSTGGYISVNIRHLPEGWQVVGIDVNGD